MLNHVSQELEVVDVADEIHPVHLGEADEYVLRERRVTKSVRMRRRGHDASRTSNKMTLKVIYVTFTKALLLIKRVAIN